MLAHALKKVSYPVLVFLLLLSYTGTVWARDSWVADSKTKCMICFVVDSSTGEQFGWEATTDDVDLVKAEWTGPVVADKADGQGVIKFTLSHRDGGNLWVIQGKAMMKAGKLDGKAKLEWAGYLFDGVSFVGYYKEGRREGRGIYRIDQSGCRETYDGDWQADRFSGKGLYLRENCTEMDGEKYYDGIEEMYYGEWKDNCRNGQGIIMYSDGRVYTGEWENGAKQGKGVFKWPETGNYQGDIYDGDWRNDVMDGRGIMRYPDGSIMYQGDWKNGKIDGEGVYRWMNGEEYSGQFKASQREGKGIMKYVNGDVYEGEWQADHRNGQGELRDASGKLIFKGEWKDDQPLKP